MFTDKIRNFASWIGQQADAFLGNLIALVSVSPGEWLPNGVWDTIVWVAMSATWSVGTSTATKQITASVALGLTALLASWVTLGATLVLVGFFAVTFAIGVFRLIPAVDKRFVAIRDMLIP